MNKKTVVVALSCLLVSMPIFAKGFILDKLMKSNRHILVKNSKIASDFSGLWVGQCDEPLEGFSTLKIVQNDKYITIKDPSKDEETGFKFPIQQVISKTVSSLDFSQHSLISSSWIGPDIVDLSLYEISEESSDHSTSSYQSSLECRLALENGKLILSTFNYPKDLVCVYDKQG